MIAQKKMDGEGVGMEFAFLCGGCVRQSQLGIKFYINLYT